MNLTTDIPSRKEIILRKLSAGKKIAAVYPIHYPRELFRAFDIHPVEVWGPPKIDTKIGSAHLQPYICSVVQSGLSFYFEGGLKDVSVIMVPHCCDSLQGLGSIFKDFVKPPQELITLYLPREKSERSIQYLSKQIEAIYERLSSLTGNSPSKEKLMEEVLREEEIDDQVRAFYKNRERFALSSREFYTVLRAREFLPSQEFRDLLTSFQTGPERGQNKVRLLLSGLLPEPMEILDVIDDSGGMVIVDDFACCMRRRYGRGDSNDPFERMAQRIVAGPPDSTKGSSFDERFSFLTALAESADVEGIIFYNVKFCEPEHFYHPILKERLKKKGYRVLILETDIHQPLSQQTMTRVKAFIEMLQGGK